MTSRSEMESSFLSTDVPAVSTIGNISLTRNLLFESQNQNAFVRVWNFLLREIAAEKAWIKSRGVCMWLFNDHLLAILAAVILIFFIASILFGRKVTKRQKRKMIEANAVKSEDYLLYRPLKGQPLTMNVKVCHQNVPRYLLPMYERSLTEIAIPYTPVVDKLQFNEPGSPSKHSKRPKPSASSPAIMNGLWVKLEKVLKAKTEGRKESNTLQARQSKSDEEALRCCHQRQASYDPRPRRVCSDCQAKKTFRNTMGVAVCGSDESFGFEDIDLNDDDWPSYMYPSRQRFANETIHGNFNQAHRRVPRLSTFPVLRTQRQQKPIIEHLEPFGLSKYLTETDSSEESDED